MCIMLTQKMVKKQEVLKKETTFHLPNDLVVSLKMRAVQENGAYSAVAEAKPANLMQLSNSITCWQISSNERCISNFHVK